MTALVMLSVLILVAACAIGMYAIFGAIFDFSDGVLKFSSWRWRMETIGYLLFIGLFVVEVLVTSMHPENVLHLEPQVYVALGFAAFRTARTISFNSVMGWLRKPFSVVVKDSSGAGDSIEPSGKGLRYAIGSLLCCPICTGTHAAGMLLTLISLFPAVGIIATYILAIAGLSETLHWWSEKNEWEGRNAREQAGGHWLYKNGRAEQKIEKATIAQTTLVSKYPYIPGAHGEGSGRGEIWTK